MIALAVQAHLVLLRPASIRIVSIPTMPCDFAATSSTSQRAWSTRNQTTPWACRKITII